MREAPYVLDGLHHHAHQTDLRISEHYTDTAGATDHVFGLCHLLGYRCAPRIKDLKDRKLYTVEKPSTWPLLAPLIGDTVETAAILGQWAELMRLKASIETGAVVPSVILRKLAAAGANRGTVDGHVAAGFARLTREDTTEKLCTANTAYGVVNDVGGFARHPALRRVVVDTPNGPVSLAAPPVLSSDGPRTLSSVPAIGEHSAAIRAEFAVG
jgi:hypothetical protein